jgi:glycosyltransferase involved in cell wall biosynthesis
MSTSRATPTDPPVLGLLISAPVFEDVFGRVGIGRAEYLRTYDNDWICYYSKLLSARGFRLCWYLFSRAARRAESAVHEPSGSEVRFLPVPRLYNWWTQRLPYVWRFRLHLATVSSAFAGELRRRPPDLLWIQDYESGRFDVGSLLAARLRIPVVGQYHGGHSPATAPLGALRRWALRRAALILAPNHEEYRRVRDAYDLGGRAVYFPNPMPMPPPSSNSAAAIKTGLGLADTDRYVLFIGRIDANKGVNWLLAAWRRLAPSRPDLHLVIAGDGSDRQALQTQAADLEHVHFLGWVADRARVFELHSAATVVACPSYSEAYCYAAAEAMAMGRPVVASAVGGLRDLVDDGHTGLLVPPGDDAALAGALAKVLEDPSVAHAMGQAARERFEREFSEPVLASRLVDHVRGVIASRCPE